MDDMGGEEDAGGGDCKVEHVAVGYDVWWNCIFSRLVLVVEE